eukprot:scaffold26728_cov33-Tisochrysis_lutea.AAC.5
MELVRRPPAQSRDGVPCHARRVVDNRARLKTARHAIGERRLADVGPADQHDRRAAKGQGKERHAACEIRPRAVEAERGGGRGGTQRGRRAAEAESARERKGRVGERERRVAERDGG